jgi:hypothetical protein
LAAWPVDLQLRDTAEGAVLEGYRQIEIQVPEANRFRLRKGVYVARVICHFRFLAV